MQTMTAFAFFTVRLDSIVPSANTEILYFSVYNAPPPILTLNCYMCNMGRFSWVVKIGLFKALVSH